MLLAIAVLLTFERLHATPQHHVNDLLGVISITSPHSLAQARLRFFATFSKLPPSPVSLEVWVPPGEPEGCELDLPAVPVSRSVVVVLRRGTCDFVQKSLRAQAAGAKGLIIVDSNDNGTLGLLGLGPNPSKDQFAKARKVDIIVLGIEKALGDSLINWAIKNPSEPAVIEFKVYKPSFKIVAMTIILGATVLVAASAFYATANVRPRNTLPADANSQQAQPQETETEDDYELVNASSGPVFCVVGSLFLVALFFLMRYLVYILMLGFCFAGCACLAEVSSRGLAQHVPEMRKRLCTIPVLGSTSIADLVSSLLSVAVVAAWVILRNTTFGWIPQDILGTSLILTIMKTIRIPNTRIAALFLGTMFFFDVFWVFLSPIFFKQSVMVTVATGGDTGEHVPMVFRVPSFGDPFGSEGMLGYGDIILPGLLVTFLRRFDIENGKTGLCGYFAVSVVGYFCGICCVFALLYIMQTGQPALLFLVPLTLLPTHILAASRGETRNLWYGTPIAVQNDEDRAATCDEPYRLLAG
eukprot:TRINITY_DN32812_c0_g1_i2.p1 TRINITY_DN32812_c0_g1~~TRINITY_DN32812_c0_g1_i2.p1  ORF type:complete len:544 (-),score=59.94 TRINITY_DN32812_c0_g1_i2:55-1635(-)